MDALRPNCLHGGVSRLTASTINLIWMTSLCHRNLTACGSLIDTITDPAIVTLKCGAYQYSTCQDIF